ncbi:hypothetical protein ACLOJK_022228, partial [Asimina triloba]
MGCMCTDYATPPEHHNQEHHLPKSSPFAPMTATNSHYRRRPIIHRSNPSSQAPEDLKFRRLPQRRRIPLTPKSTEQLPHPNPTSFFPIFDQSLPPFVSSNIGGKNPSDTSFADPRRHHSPRHLRIISTRNPSVPAGHLRSPLECRQS